MLESTYAESTDASGTIERNAWLFRAAKGRAQRILLADGTPVSVPPGKVTSDVDIVQEASARMKRNDNDRNEPFRLMGQTAVGYDEDSNVTLAAWLLRLGHESVAADLMRASRPRGRNTSDDPIKDLRDSLAWMGYAQCVHAYMVRADDEALAAGQWLRDRYPNEAAKYEQAATILAEIKRRRARRRLDTVRETPPPGLTQMPVPRRIEWLINSLDEVDARQWSQPGGIDLASDWRVAALIAVGEPAVPALLDTLEHDRRLTRAVHFWRDFGRHRTVLSVGEAALSALMSILRVQAFEPVGTGDSFTATPRDRSKKTVKKLREYWKSYGDDPFEIRMMRVLTDPKTKSEARQEAARNLGRQGERRTLGTTVWSGSVQGPPDKPNPNITRFSNPTVAQAILAALDQDLAGPGPEYLAGMDAGQRASQLAYERRNLLQSYIGALVSLNDRRIVAEVVRRASNVRDATIRRLWARAAYDLGDAAPLTALANDLVAARVVPPSVKDPTSVEARDTDEELRDTIWMLSDTSSTTITSSLFKLAEPSHPYYSRISKHVREGNGGFESERWSSHPFVLLMLRRDLDVRDRTGFAVSIDGAQLKRVADGGESSSGVPALLSTPATRLTSTEELVRDRAAERIGELALGSPACHALLKEQAECLQRLRTFMDQHGSKWRRLTAAEARWLEAARWETTFVPDLQGELQGAYFQTPGKKSEKVLIAPASAAGGDRSVYTVIGQHVLRSVPASEPTRITRLDVASGKTSK